MISHPFTSSSMLTAFLCFILSNFSKLGTLSLLLTLFFCWVMTSEFFLVKLITLYFSTNFTKLALGSITSS